ncbi:MAG: hypothetical protein QM754_08055 [Tepidisphaeraceae bacterium]
MNAVARVSLFTVALLASGGVSVVWLVMLMAMGANASPSQELLLKRLILSVIGVFGVALVAAVALVIRGNWPAAIVVGTLPVAYCVVLLIIGLLTGG